MELAHEIAHLDDTNSDSKLWLLWMTTSWLYNGFVASFVRCLCQLIFLGYGLILFISYILSVCLFHFFSAFFSSRRGTIWLESFLLHFFSLCNLPSFHVNRTIHTVETNTEAATAFFEIIFCQCSLHKRKKMYNENWGEKTLAENKSWMSS